MRHGSDIIDATIVAADARGVRPRSSLRSILGFSIVFCATVVLLTGGSSAADRVARPPGRLAASAAAPMPVPAVPTDRTSAARVDPLVSPAGGAHAGPCGRCSRKACPQCRLPAEHAAFHGACQHGLCPAHCPVRPDVFGFYGTQWRKWPGAGAVRASFQEDATPVRPPKAEIPKATEESLQPQAGDEEAAAAAAKSEKPEKSAAAPEPAEDLPPANQKDDSGRRSPLPKPFPEADDGAAAPSPALQRARRRILLDRALEGSDVPAAIVAVEHDEPTGRTEGSTPWRRFLASPPEAPDVPSAPVP
jgi:hypothetical protein